MKKYKMYLMCAIIVMAIPFIMKFFKKSHEVKYEVAKYNIEEKFTIEKRIHNYNITIKNNDEIYTFNLNKNINKRKKVIKDIKTYKQGNIICIIPIYKRNIEKEIYCNQNNVQVSKNYLKDNDDFKKILEKAKKYKIQNIETSTKKTNYENITYYKKNIENKESYILWNYKGIYIINNEEVKYQQFLDYDLYDNIMNTITSRCYVLFENTSVNGIENIHYYDLKKDKYKIFKLEEKISKDSYINGIYEDKIYVTDKKKKVQYRINIKKEKIEEVGNEELGYIKYHNDEKEILNKSDFFMQEVYFNDKYIDEEDENNSEVIEKNNKFYYKTDSLFQEKINNNHVLLFELDNVKEWAVYKEDILLLKDNEVYLYNNKKGLNKILEYNELNYNYKNIIKLWK